MFLRRVFIPAVFFVSFHFTGFASNIPADSVTETKTISAFTVLKVQGNFNVVLYPGSGCSLKVTADKAAMPSIVVKNAGTTLNITMKEGTTGGATLYIGTKDILQISINTTGTVSCSKDIKSNDLSLNLDGKVEGTLMLNIKMLTFNSNTDKNFVLNGKVEKCNAKISGEGNTDMEALKVDDLTVDNSSDGEVKVFAKSKLNAKTSGKLTYYGKPKDKILKVINDGQFDEGK